MQTVELHPKGIKYIVVHCSATKASQRNVDVKEIDKWHRQRGMFRVGYHYVIKRDGEIQQGRALHQPGAHAIGWNHISWGVCLVGGLDEAGEPEDNFTLDQYHSLAMLLDELKHKAPQAEIIGHRDLPRVKKACPCFDVRAWLKQLDDDINALTKEQ